MTYRTDREIVQDLLPIRLFGAVITHGISDPNGETALVIMRWLAEAERDVLESAPIAGRVKLARRAWRLHDVALAPFKQNETHVAKFALIVFYMLDHIRSAGLLNFEEGGGLDRAITAVLAEDGTVAEMAGIEKVDNSAQKQARKLFKLIQAEGYYRGVDWHEVEVQQ